MADEIKEQTSKKSTQKAQEPQKNDEKQTFTMEQVQAMVAKAVAEAMAQKSTIVATEYVTLMFVGAIADKTVVFLGSKLGTITRNGGTVDIPKRDFLQNIDYKIQTMLDERKLIVVSGLTEEERKRYGVEYGNGEILADPMREKILNMDENTLINLFKGLCPSHKQYVASVYIDAYDRKDNRIRPTTVKALNNISKEVDKDGMFKTILEAMGKELAE